MKIYLFDPETHIYQGEDFADDLPMRPGRPSVSSDATTIAPPSWRRGEVPLFDVAEERWRIVSAAAAALAGPDQTADALGPVPEGPNGPTGLVAGTRYGGLKCLLFLIATLALFPFSLLKAAPLQAVSYPLSAVEPSYLKDADVMRAGAKVHLFHSGTEDVRRAIKINDVLTVYREYPPDISGVSKESGKVRVLGTLGDYYFEGVVIEGFAEPGYLAVQGSVACLVTTRLKPSR